MIPVDQVACTLATKSTTPDSMSPTGASRGLIRRILVPVDFSRTSLRGLDHAIRLAQRLDAELAIVHILDHVIIDSAYYVPLTQQMEFDQQVVVDARKDLANLIRDKVGTEISCSTEVLIYPHPDVAIVDHAVKSNVDLIVMGTHGREGLAHVFLGSVTESVIRKSTCPVLVVSPPMEWAAESGNGQVVGSESS